MKPTLTLEIDHKAIKMASRSTQNFFFFLFLIRNGIRGWILMINEGVCFTSFRFPSKSILRHVEVQDPGSCGGMFIVR